MVGLSNLNEAFYLIKTNFSDDEITGGKPIDKHLIKEAENILGVTLPNSYGKFIEEFGYGGARSLLVSGIRCVSINELQSTGFVWRTIKNRAEFSQPNNIITLDDIGDGSYYALDISQMNAEHECPVVIWPLNGYEDTPVLEIVAPDFGTWFLEQVREQIKRKQEKT